MDIIYGGEIGETHCFVLVMMNDINSSCMQGKFATRVGQVLRECDSDKMLPKQQQNPAEDNFTRIIPRRFTTLPPPTTTTTTHLVIALHLSCYVRSPVAVPSGHLHVFDIGITVDC